MAKISVNQSFTNGVISINEEGRIILEEIKKDDTITYDLTSILESLSGASEVSITIKNTTELDSNIEE